MKLTIEEIEVIRDALTIALTHIDEIDNVNGTIHLLDRIDEEYDFD